MFTYFQYSPWVLSPPVTASPADFQQIEAPQQSNTLPPFVKNKLLTSCLKTSANGLKVIRIEIYDADQFSSTEDSTCKCSAEICAQHVVSNFYSDPIYIRIREILKSMENSMYVNL